jgi:methylated-DNA-[protein]-cysteine S-methyltransferase
LSGTPFQVRVWNEIARIPFGRTISYGELAERVGSADAVRAVGTATGRNPVCWIVPCHRVVGKDGSLTGFAGGLERKRAFLDFESGKSAMLAPEAELVAA